MNAPFSHVLCHGEKVFVERSEAEIYTEALRWIAEGKTGSYGSPQAFAAAVLDAGFLGPLTPEEERNG